jgi:hypothetical protein
MPAVLHWEDILGTLHDRIYEKAKPYLDTRQNEVHVALSFAFALRLLKAYPEADEDVVVPAILLHDVGWKMVPEEKQLQAFGPKATDGASQRFHEVAGVRIAGDILNSLNYDEEKKLEICAIIDGHDSRLKTLSLNDSLVKDADKLWRCTPVGIDIDHRRFGIDREAYLGFIASKIEEWFFTPHARVLAREALDEARAVSGQGAAI